MKGVEWQWDATTSTATPGAWKLQTEAMMFLKSKLSEFHSIPTEQRPPNYDTMTTDITKQITICENKINDAKRKASSSLYTKVHVVQRHHFSSALQRMSVVCKCDNDKNHHHEDWYCLVKGSPEALKTLLTKGTAPDWYEATYVSLARRGLRVLALGYKKVKGTDNPKDRPRDWVENELTFAGFIAFECKIRADSSTVVQALIDSDHYVAMLTGDALLTSLHVARQVGICNKTRSCLTLHTDNNKYYWTHRDDTTGIESETPFSLDTLVSLGQQYDLLTTEADFIAVADATGQIDSPIWKNASLFKVFARMSPQGKASIIRSIQKVNAGAHVLMCGDGGNDVGALKQADVGIALLAGHANTNTTDDSVDVSKQVTTTTTSASATTSSTITSSSSSSSAEDVLNAHDAAIKKRAEQINAMRAAHIKKFQAEYQKKQAELLQVEMKARMEKGEYMAMFSVMKNQAVVMKQALDAENRRFMMVHGQVWDPKKDTDSATGGSDMLGSLMTQMEQADQGAGGLPMVRPGDASIAAPFTSRVPSIRAVIDLIRQGRCTLLSALMQQQIMMLESTIAAYTLSALSLHNARSSERQMMASSWLIMTAAVSFSYATPLDRMHPLRPLRSLFQPAIILSTLGQALIHIICMTLAVQWATDAMGPEKLKEVTEFFRKAKAKEIDIYAKCGEDDMICLMNAFWTAPFMPNLLNSTVFLVETSQMISVFFANYKGITTTTTTTNTNTTTTTIRTTMDEGYA